MISSARQRLDAAKPAPPVPKSGVRNGTLDESNYNAASIEVLEGLEPVRRRPGMYVAARTRTACIICLPR